MSREEKKPRFVAIVGPTASGKSSVALHLARAFQGEILSADSMQIYRRLNIGTAKPSPEEQATIRHHLIDILDPDEGYSAAVFRRQAEEVIRDLHSKGIPIFLVGGTGLYLKVLTRGLFRGPSRNPAFRLALEKRAKEQGNRVLFEELKKLDPETAARIQPGDRMRLIRALEVYSLSQKTISQFHREHGFTENPFTVLKIGLVWERSTLIKKIDERVKEMVALGWVEEVRSLLNSGYHHDLKSLQSLGYRQIIGFIRGESTLEETVRTIQRETRRYAKRQMTWFKTDPEIIWFAAEGNCLPVIEKKVADFFQGN